MASQINNLGTTALIILVVTILVSALYFVSGDISNKNTKLDAQSIQTINNLGVEYSNNINTTSFETESGEFNDSTFDGVDAFARQYLEDKSEIEQKRGIVNTVLLYPSFLLSVFGVSNEIILLLFGTTVYGVISFFIGLQVYKAIRTGDVD